MQTYRRSRFLHLLERDGVCCLLHSITLKRVYGTEILRFLFNAFSEFRTVDELVARSRGQYSHITIAQVITDFVDSGLIVAEPTEDERTYLEHFYEAYSQYAIRHMYFIPASSCNLRCKYCYTMDASDPPVTSRMTLETARLTLDVFAALSHGSDSISLSFFGGEPLVNAPVVYDSMRYVRSLEKKGSFSRHVDLVLQSNGVLVDSQTVEIVSETGSHVTLSLDGPSVLNDHNRVDTGNRGTFQRTLSAFRQFQRAGVNPSISCTLTSTNIGHIDQILAFIILDLKPSGVGFNVLTPTFDGKNACHVDDEFVVTQLIHAFGVLRQEGLYEDRVMRRVTPFVNGAFYAKDCMGVGGQIVVSPEGRVGPCQGYLGRDQNFPLKIQDLHARLPRLHSDDVYSDTVFDRWRQRFPLNNKVCVDCFAVGVCGGGCPYAAECSSGSIYDIDTRICYQSKGILEWMVWDAYENQERAEMPVESSV